MTLIVCPNLAIDRVLSLPSLRTGATLRGRVLAQQAGGKGANVLRALRSLGGDGLLTGFAAGAGGRLIAELATWEGLAVDLVASEGEARVSTVVLADDEPATRFFEFGPEIGEPDERALIQVVTARAASPGEWAIVDGAAQPGSSDQFYSGLCAALRRAGYKVMLDATGAQLIGALAERPDVVKVNREEAASAVGDANRTAVSDEAAVAGLELCERLLEAGAGEAVVTLGRAGAVGILHGREWRIFTGPVTAVNTTGSGDCFAAALLLGLERDDPIEEALAMAAGVGAANTADPVTSRFDVGFARDLAGRAFVGPPGSFTPR